MTPSADCAASSSSALNRTCTPGSAAARSRSKASTVYCGTHCAGSGNRWIAALRALERVLDDRERAAEQPGRKHDVGRIVVRQRRGFPELRRNPPAPQVLHRADVGGLGAGLRAGARILLDHESRYAAKAELDRERQPGRSRTDDQNVRLGAFSHDPDSPSGFCSTSVVPTLRVSTVRASIIFSARCRDGGDRRRRALTVCVSLRSSPAIAGRRI